ncbi:interleukin-6 [Rhineura floridana]|uniref:interleukin-6 n=1 Tax=Rhineura floridana TaxID=261503 RepID=UPI002AC84CD9|nr:interleukin-6 [Rhineura floridana]
MPYNSFSSSGPQATKLLQRAKGFKPRGKTMRVLLGCVFCAAAALMLFLRAEALPVAAGDSSGEEELSDEPSARTSPTRSPQLTKSVSLARWLQGRAAGLTKELCEKQNVCKGSMELLALNNLHLPKITPEDKCYYIGFDKETCLGRISSGLYAFQTFLEYLEATSVTNAHIFGPSAGHLANTLRSMLKYSSLKYLFSFFKVFKFHLWPVILPSALPASNACGSCSFLALISNDVNFQINNPETVTLPDPAAQKILSAKLQENRGWSVTVIKHLILQEFTTFMEKTTRAIRFL